MNPIGKRDEVVQGGVDRYDLARPPHGNALALGIRPARLDGSHLKRQGSIRCHRFRPRGRLRDGPRLIGFDMLQIQCQLGRTLVECARQVHAIRIQLSFVRGPCAGNRNRCGRTLKGDVTGKARRPLVDAVKDGLETAALIGLRNFDDDSKVLLGCLQCALPDAGYVLGE